MKVEWCTQWSCSVVVSASRYRSLYASSPSSMKSQKPRSSCERKAVSVTQAINGACAGVASTMVRVSVAMRPRLPNGLRREDRAALGLGCDARSQDDGRAEQVAVLFDGLPRIESDADVQRF